MIDKVLIIEIQNEACIAMCDDGRLIRIRYKDGLKVGDKVYILEEDVMDEKKEAAFYPQVFKKVVTVLAAFLLCIGLWNMNTVEAYAMVSIDGSKSLQLELDENSNVIQAYSKDNSYTKKQLEEMKGKNIESFSELKTRQLIGIASYGKGKDKKLIHQVKKAFGTQSYYALGTKDDIKNSEKENKSLGVYLIEQSVFENEFEEQSLADLKELIRLYPELSNDEEFLEEMEDKKEEEQERENELMEQELEFEEHESESDDFEEVEE